MNKIVKLDQETLKLLNLSIAKIIEVNPNIKKPSDCETIKISLKNYLGDI